MKNHSADGIMNRQFLFLFLESKCPAFHYNVSEKATTVTGWMAVLHPLRQFGTPFFLHTL